MKKFPDSKNFCKVLLLSLLIISCTERIEINTSEATPRLSVFGYITNYQGYHYIKITYTAGYFTSDAPEGISNALVSISDGENRFYLTEVPDSVGVYRTSEDFFGIQGKTYTLDISLDFDKDGQNEEYQAIGYMPYITVVDSVVLSPSLMPMLPNLLLYGLVPDIQSNHLALYLKKNSDKQTIFDYFIILTDSYFEGYIINGYEFPCFVRDGIEKGDTITFKVSSFSREFTHFISNARSEVGGSNPIFGGPPVDVETNIRPLDKNSEIKTAGFFGAFPWDEKYTIAERDFK